MKKNFKLTFLIIQIIFFIQYISLASSQDSISDSFNSDLTDLISGETSSSDLKPSDLTSSDSYNSGSILIESSDLDSTSYESSNLDSTSNESSNLDSTSSESSNSDSASSDSNAEVIFTIPATTTPTTTTPGNTTNTNPIIKKSSSGLSTGAICAIAIPTIAALLGVATAAALFTGASTPLPPALPSLPEPNFVDTSLEKFRIVNEMPVQQPQPQPVQIVEQPRPIQIEPIKEVPRANYPVNRVLEPPRVNNTFQYNTMPQQMQMVPVQEVQMVPVQEVQMVPVEEVQMVPVQQMGMAPVQQVVPMNQVIQIGQAAEAVPQVAEVSALPVTEAIPQGQLGSQLISSASEFIPQSQVLSSEVIPNIEGTQVLSSQVLPTQVLPSIDHGVQVLPSKALPNIDQGFLP